MPYIVCDVIWMPRYQAEFSFVADEGMDGSCCDERSIFLSRSGICYGGLQSNTGYIDIEMLGAQPDETFIDDVTVIWTATRPEGGRVIVGWYRRSRAFKFLQVGRLKVHRASRNPVGHFFQASSKNAFLIDSRHRSFAVPYGGLDTPDTSPVSYPERSTSRQMRAWLRRVKKLVSEWTGPAVETPDLPAIRALTHRRGWAGRSRSTEATHDGAVEAAATDAIIRRLGPKHIDRQKEGCGWDFEFRRGREVLCVAVKGTSKSAVDVEVSPSEYLAIKRVERGEFVEGSYRLAVVSSALSLRAKLHLFKYENGSGWVCEWTGKRLNRIEQTAAKVIA